MKYHNSFFVIPLFFFSASAMSAVTPKITKISVTPTSAPAGTMFKFTAELNAPLTTGNKVKIDLGKGLASMTGKNTSYSLSRAMYAIGTQTYKVGIYNSKNVLQGKVSSGNYTVSSSTNNPPTLTLVSGDDTVEQYKVYTLQLKASDVDNNLRLFITVDWNDGSTSETQMATNDPIRTFTHTYTTAGKFALSATAKDRGTPALTSEPLSKTIEVIAPPARNYSKICNNGALEGEEDCPTNPELGSKPTDWACTKDNDTGLIWEVKKNDGGLRDWKKMYTNHISYYYPNELYAETNANGFVLDVNSQVLCGANDWRLPTKDELLSIVKLSNIPTIDTTYFPNTRSGGFWSSSPNAGGSDGAWVVYFDGGYDNYGYKNNNNYVRLVR